MTQRDPGSFDTPRIRLVADNGGAPAGAAPILKDGDGGGTSDGMGTTAAGSIEGRVSRLELGFCAAFVFIVIGALALYGKLADRSDVLNERIQAVAITQTEMRGDMKLMTAKLETIDKRLESADGKLDKLLESDPSTLKRIRSF